MNLNVKDRLQKWLCKGLVEELEIERTNADALVEQLALATYEIGKAYAKLRKCDESKDGWRQAALRATDANEKYKLAVEDRERANNELIEALRESATRAEEQRKAAEETTDTCRRLYGHEIKSLKSEISDPQYLWLGARIRASAIESRNRHIDRLRAMLKLACEACNVRVPWGENYSTLEKELMGVMEQTSIDAQAAADEYQRTTEPFIAGQGG